MTSAAERVTPIEAVPRDPAVAPYSEAVMAAQEIQHDPHGDVLGAFSRLRHNLGRNALLASNAVALAYDATLNSVGVEMIPTGLAYETAGAAVIGGGLYGASRLWEKRQVNKADKLQTTVRDTLEQPVDVFKTGRRKALIRWYGCDKNFLPVPSDDTKKPELDAASSANSLESVVKFAKDAKIPEVAVSAKVLELIPGADTDKFGKLVANDELTRTKRKQIVDLVADESVLRCDVAGAEALLAEIKAKTTHNALQHVVDLLRQVRPDHPFIAHAQKMISNTDPKNQDVLAQNGRSILRPRIEQTASNGTSLINHVDRLGNVSWGREYTFARLRGDALERVGIAQMRGGTMREMTSYKGQADLLTSFGFESVEELLQDTIDRSRPAPKDSNEERADIVPLAPNVIQERAEAAGWLLTQEPLTAQVKARPNTAAVLPYGSKDMPQTLQDRIIAERPRSILRHMRRTGKNTDGDPTVHYENTKVRRIKRMVGAVALIGVTAAAGLGIGAAGDRFMGTNYNHLESEYAISQGYKDGKLPVEQYDSFWNWLKTAPGARADIYRAYEGAFDADSTIDDALIQYLPPQAYNLRPYADPSWTYKKEQALKNLNNAYTDGSDKSGIGDVTTDKHGLAWQLTPANGASTAGYWPQAVQHYITTEGVDGSDIYGFTPPYKKYEVNYAQSGNYEPVAHDPSDIRHLQLMDASQLPSTMPVIKVEGQKLYDSSFNSDMSVVPLPDPEDPGGVINRSGYALPVQLGGDIVAATANEYSLYDNKFIGSQKIDVVQLPNGSFYMLFDDQRRDRESSYMNISYVVKPKADTTLPVHAESPMVIPSHGYDQQDGPLNQIVTSEQALDIWRTLSGNPNATKLPTADEAVAAVQNGKTYSFTPYADGHVQLTLDRPKNDGEGLATIAKTEAALPSANCNMTTTVGLIASRGQLADGGFVNPAVGYHNDGDNQLLTGEAHMWLVGNKGQTIDGTPGGGAPDTNGKGEGFDPNMNPVDEVMDNLKKGVGGLVLAGLLVGLARGGRRYGPAAVNKYNAHLDAVATGKLHPGEDADQAETDRLHDIVSIIQWMNFAPEGAKLNENKMPGYFESARSQQLARRYAALPTVTAKQMRNQIAELEQTGRLTISEETKRAMISFARRHKRAQAARRAELATPAS